jgi:hypothetical protein
MSLPQALSQQISFKSDRLRRSWNYFFPRMYARVQERQVLASSFAPREECAATFNSEHDPV